MERTQVLQAVRSSTGLKVSSLWELGGSCPLRATCQRKNHTSGIIRNPSAETQGLCPRSPALIHQFDSVLYSSSQIMVYQLPRKIIDYVCVRCTNVVR